MWTSTSDRNSTRTICTSTSSKPLAAFKPKFKKQGRRYLHRRRVKTICILTLAAALTLVFSGCEIAAVQTMEVALATPSPIPQVYSIREAGAGDQPVFGMSVLSPVQGTMQEDGTFLTEDGERLPVMDVVDPTPTIPLTPSPVPTAPPPTPWPPVSTEWRSTAPTAI